MARWIAGLDGCRGAWAGVLLDLDAPDRHRSACFARVTDLMDGPEAPLMVGIDVPIGLADRVIGGGRAADRAARAYLGKARSSVFPVPPRAAVYAGDYAAAKDLSRTFSDPPFAPSIQCWNITPSIREVDGLLRARPTLAERLREVHPELAFRRLNRDGPLRAAKEGSRAGGGPRRAPGEPLVAAGLPEALVGSAPPRHVGADDHLDAMAALVVARDILLERATPLPDSAETDGFGLPVVIWMPAGPARTGGDPRDPC